MEPTEQQAYQWFIEKLTGTLSAGDEVVLAEALAADPALRARWEGWMEEARGMNMPGFVDGLDAGAGLERLHERMGTGRVLRVRRLVKIAAAAAVVFIVVTASYYSWFRPASVYDKQKITVLVQRKKPVVTLRPGNGQPVDLTGGNGVGGSGQTIRLADATLSTGAGSLRYTSVDTAQNVLSVPAGSTYRVTLSDGTQVVLNASTVLRFPFSFPGSSREVYVEGEAYFKVAPDAHRPFIVHTPLTEVRVLGTSFDVNTYLHDKVRTALVEGKVLAIGKDGVTAALSPGVAADYDAAKGFVTGTFEADDELSWMNGVYYFHDMPVADLATLASRCYGVHIIVHGDGLAGRSVTGLLETGKLAEFLNDLETTAHIKCHYSGSDLYFE